MRAVVKNGDATLRSAPVTISIRKPSKDDPERPAMERIHHTPWSNYEANAFCGDTFDVVKRWPTSRFTKYCHYYNGLHQQHKKEYARALESYRSVVEKYPEFALADHAALGEVECLCELKKFSEARKAGTQLRERLAKRKAGPTAVRRLADDLERRINRELARQE